MGVRRRYFAAGDTDPSTGPTPTRERDSDKRIADDCRSSSEPAPSGGPLRSGRFHDVGYVPAVVWASIVRTSAPPVIGTLRGLADSATGMRSVSTPVS